MRFVGATVAQHSVPDSRPRQPEDASPRFPTQQPWAIDAIADADRPAANRGA